MSIVLGLDVGTTSLSAVAFDCDTRQVVAQLTLPNEGARLADLPEGLLSAELDLACVGRQVTDLLAGIVRALPAGATVLAIGVTGQQHGMVLLDGDGRPVGNAITWQDQRTQCRMPGDSRSWLQAFVDDAGGPGAFAAMGCQPAAGFLGPSLYWWRHQDSRAADNLHVCLIPDAVVSMLTGTAPVTDVTDGGSSGLMDIVTGDWSWEAVDRLRLPREVFPPVLPAGTPDAPLRKAIADAAGLPQVPVCVAAGDNQASFAGSVHDPLNTVLVNVGTGGQISTLVPSFSLIAGVETRAFFGNRYLLVGAGLYGGRAYAYLQELFQNVGTDFFGQDASLALFETMNRLAALVPPGSDGLRCVPLFTGTREDPDRRASFTGIGPTNLTPAHMARALLEGIAEGFYEQYAAMLPAAGARRLLVGAGNGLTQNPVLADIVARRFDLPLHLAGDVEAAALGAALLAADGIGVLPLSDGMASISYDRVVNPPEG
ncbi:MAG: FGGY family carbohydrate kinase [Anaerolineae bacterium]